MSIKTRDELFSNIDSLIDAWCDRRCFKALRYILNGYPLVSGLTDDWYELLQALKHIRATAKDELTQEEKGNIAKLIIFIEDSINF